MEEYFRPKESAILFILVILLFFASIVISPKNKRLAFAGDTISLSGYAWSDNIGWVSLSGPSYGLVADNNGKLSGYAWSDNIGWITSNQSELSGCPSNPCWAKIDGSALTGWLRALSHGGGWDGWISLSGPGYGVTQNGTTLSGYAWGSDVVGWLDFSPAVIPAGCTPSYSCSGTQTIQYTDSLCQTSTTATCVLPTFCSAGSSTCLYPQPSFVSSTGFTGHIQILPALVSRGDTARVYWNVNNVTSCTVIGTNGDSWSGISAGCDGTNCSSGATGKQSSPITGQTTYALSCTAYPGVVPPSIVESAVVNITPIFQEL